MAQKAHASSKKKNSNTTKELVTAIFPLLLIITSLMIGALYYQKQKSVMQSPKSFQALEEADSDANTAADSQTKQAQEDPGSPKESLNTANNQQAPGIEIAIPDHIFAYVQDSQGRQTGRISADAEVVNNIPRSEYIVDEKAQSAQPQVFDDGIVHWISIQTSEAGVYSVRLSNAKQDDTIIVYGTNADGKVTTELVDVYQRGAALKVAGDGSAAFSFDYDPAADIDSIEIIQRR